MMNQLRIGILSLLLLASTAGRAQSLADSEGADPEGSDELLRLGGVTDYAGEEPVATPAYVKQQPIEMNGAEWLLWDEPMRTYSIVHIGDSHLQADIATNVTRELMQLEFGDAGRGLIEPLRLTGTNEPLNYIFRSNISWTAERFMKPSGREQLGFTGCALTAVAPAGYIEVATNDNLDWNPFSTVTLYAKGRIEVTGVAEPSGFPLPYEAVTEPAADGTERIIVSLYQPVTSARISIRSLGKVTLYGAFLSADRPGVFYNVIGHNGATYYNYNLIPSFAEGVAAMRPDLVVISLGTNEAFGGAFNAEGFRSQIDRLVNSLRDALPPTTGLLLVTPQECQRRMGRTRSSSRGKRRRKAASAGSFAVNSNVARARDVILDYGRKHGIATYDFYAVSGGSGSSSRWVADNLFSKDRIHLSGSGYRLQGRLLYEAISAELRAERAAQRPSCPLNIDTNTNGEVD